MKLTNFYTMTWNSTKLSRTIRPWTSFIVAILFAISISASAQDLVIGSAVNNPNGTTVNVAGNLIINSPGVLTNAGTFVVAGNVVINAGGTISNTSTGIITVSSILNIATRWFAQKIICKWNIQESL